MQPKTYFMKKELIHELFEKFEQACYVYKDVECWSGRDLQTLFNYSEWRNFLKVIDKARMTKGLQSFVPKGIRLYSEAIRQMR